MARYYLIPKSLAERVPGLSRFGLWLEALFFRGLFRAVQSLSPERAVRVGRALFGRLGPHSDKARKADVNLAIAFPDQDADWRARTVREIFRSLGESAAELIKLEQIWQERDRRIAFDIDPAAAALIDARRPIVFVCAHVGAWQLTNLIARHAGLEISTVIARESNPLMDQAMQKLRSAFGVQLVPTDAGARPLLRELRAGRCVGMATDTRLPTGTLLPFFGREALTNTTAARLALRSGAALLPIYCERLGDAHFRVRVLAPLYTPESQPLPAGSEAQDALALQLSEQINRQFEDWIRAAPGQWICLKRRWPKAHKL